MLADSHDITLTISSFICLFSIFSKLYILDHPFHIQQNKQIHIIFRITNSTLMDRIYPKALADINIWVKQMLWAVKVRAKMILKKTNSFISAHEYRCFRDNNKVKVNMTLINWHFNRHKICFMVCFCVIKMVVCL